MSEKLYRIQDVSGRGPWRPGFSHMWIDPEKDDRDCPPMMVEFPQWQRQIARAVGRGLMHYGCCVSGEIGIRRWFTTSEIERLKIHGFSLVDASSLEPICKGKAQIIGASRWPLSYLPKAEWELVA